MSSLVRLETTVKLLRKAFAEWLKDDASLLAAALAYYGLFSFVPLLILTLIFINSLFSFGFLDGQVVALSQDLVGRQMPDVAGELIDRASDQAASFSFTLLSVGLLLFGAAGLFVHTRKAFRIIWKIPDNVVPIMDTIFTYLRSYLLIALVAFMLLVTSLFTALLLPAAKQIEEFLPIHLGLLRMLTFLVSFFFVTLLFAATYKTLIEVRLAWQEVLPGSALAALLIAAGNFCIEAYVSIVNVGSAYGAAGSLVIFLFWIYYSAQIFLFGAEVIKVQKRVAGDGKQGA
ncbi:MAG: YihY/virulence factor BrkB family protein [Methanothrix sp.]|jgi:membrane protein|nr:YihY/virulence factor BrkB family protein [Methanothrix sp.]